MSPSKVDVNVHPAKLEVRFQEESKVFQAIYHAIKDTLLKGDLISDTQKNEESKEINTQNQNEGLFNLKKPKAEKIEDYINQESKIKTNVGNLVEDVYKERQNKEKTVNQETTNFVNTIKGGQINTRRHLRKAKKDSARHKRRSRKESKIKIK